MVGRTEELAAVVQNEKVISLIERPETNTSEKVNVLAELVELKSDELKISLLFWQSKNVCLYCLKSMLNIKL